MFEHFFFYYYDSCLFKRNSPKKKKAIESIFFYLIRKKRQDNIFSCTFVHLSIADEHMCGMRIKNIDKWHGSFMIEQKAKNIFIVLY